MAALTKQSPGQHARRPIKVRQWHKDSAAKDASRANLEPQAVCRNVAALSLTVRCRLQLGSRWPSGPWPCR